MADPVRPAPAKLYGRRNGLWIPTGGIASGTLAPTVAEYNAASAIEMTLRFFQAPQPTPNTNLVDEERRWGDTKTFQQIGTTTYQGGTFTAAMDHQAAAAAEAVKAWEAFIAGASGFWVFRKNVARATSAAAGQFVDVWPSDVGPATPVDQGDGESAQDAFQASYVITSDPKFKVAILA